MFAEAGLRRDVGPRHRSPARSKPQHDPGADRDQGAALVRGSRPRLRATLRLPGDDVRERGRTAPTSSASAPSSPASSRPNVARPALSRIISQEAQVDGPRLEHLFHRWIRPFTEFGEDQFPQLRERGMIRFDSVPTMFFFMTFGAGARRHIRRWPASWVERCRPGIRKPLSAMRKRRSRSCSTAGSWLRRLAPNRLRDICQIKP